MDSVAEAVKKIMNEEESGLRMAAHAAHKSGQKMFTFKGKTYPVKVQGESVGWGEAIEEEKDCVTEPKAKEIAKKEVHGHEKKMHKEEKEDNPSAKMSSSYGKQDQEETPARKSIKAHGGPVEQPKMGLAKEEAEQIDELKKSTVKSYISKKMDTLKGKNPKKDQESLMRAHHRVTGVKPTSEEVEQIEERELSAGEASEKERLVKSMKKSFSGFRKRYGERAKSVMYATATKMAKEETEQVDEKVDVKKKTVDTLAGRVKVPADTHNQHVSTKVELKSEGWDDMMKSVQDRAKPQPSGGSGVKMGSRYGGGKQKEKPEHDEDKKKVKEDSHVVPKGKMLLEPEKNVKLKKLATCESKRPEQDNVPFVTSESKPLTVAKDLAHKAMKRIKSEMLGKTGTSE